jgi:hypothetical protein
MKTTKNFKIRSSAAGQIMTNPRSKTELLSETTKSYVFDWLKEEIYGYRKEISSKYITKGIELEDEAIDKAIELLDLPFTLKNEQHFEDDYFTGTPDLIIGDTVYDIKNSWDCFTFPLFDTEIPNKGYYYQLQVYMHLLGLKKAQLIYVLLNTPEHIESWVQPKDYDNLDKQYRIKTFDVVYDESVIDDLIQRVDNIREFITTINI